MSDYQTRWECCMNLLRLNFPNEFTDETRVYELPEKLEKLGLVINTTDSIVSAIPKIEEFLAKQKIK